MFGADYADAVSSLDPQKHGNGHIQDIVWAATRHEIGEPIAHFLVFAFFSSIHHDGSPRPYLATLAPNHAIPTNYDILWPLLQLVLTYIYTLLLYVISPLDEIAQ